MNDDGRVDLVVTLSSDHEVHVFLQTDDGGLPKDADFVLDGGATPRFAQSCDVNGDGRSDLLVATLVESSIAVFHQRVDGGFTETPTSRLLFPETFSGGASFMCRDLSTDGRSALVVVQPGGEELRIVRAR